MEEQKKTKKRTPGWGNSWINHPFFKYSIGTLLVLLILLVFSYDASILTPILDFISILFIPIVLSLLLYYLLRPIVDFLQGKLKIPRWGGILIIYAVFAVLIVLFVAYLAPLLIKQLSEMANTSIETFSKIRATANSIMSRFFYLNLDKEIEQKLFEFAQQLTAIVSKNALDVLGFLTRIAIILAVIPFIVFYLLKDDEEFAATFLKVVPEDFGREARKVLHNMDQTLSSYINGLVIVSSTVGVMLFFGYLIIGLNYALILAVIAFIFMTIPFLGPFLAICPALFVGFADSPFMVLKVVVVFVIVQQLESNLISPQVIGQRLNIHPLTIILLLLAAGSLYGLIGLLLATPLYALSKVLIENIYKIYRLHYSLWKKKSAE